MGGKSKASTTSTQTTTNKTLNAAASDIENGSVVMNSGDNATITTTDYGALKAAGDIAYEALEVTGKTVDSLAYSQKNSTAAMERVAQSAATGGQSIVADSLVKVFQPLAVGVIVLAVLFVIYLIMRGRSRV